MSQALPPGISIASFSEGYRKFFEVVPATNNHLKRHNYHLRHEVYARELGWEPTRADEIQTDEYDVHSHHCLVRAVATHLFVGCARLVLADPRNPDTPLPFETVCNGALDRRIVDPTRLNRSAIAEMSHLAVIGQYRRRAGEGSEPFSINDDFGIAPRIRLPYLTLGLYLASIALARWHHIETIFVLADPALIHSMAHLGVDMRTLGAPIEYHGLRVPTIVDVERVVASMASYVRPLFDSINEEVNRALQTPC